MVHELKHVSNWIEKTAKAWNVPEEALIKRAEMAFRHKREFEVLCGRDIKTWHFQDYFDDIRPFDLSISQVYDPKKRRNERAQEAAEERQRAQAVHNQLREKLGMPKINWNP